jgi:hypothetical protein
MQRDPTTEELKKKALTAEFANRPSGSGWKQYRLLILIAVADYVGQAQLSKKTFADGKKNELVVWILF